MNGQHDPVSSMRTAVSGQAWPPMPAGHGALLGALLFQLERSQWLDANELSRRQLGQLARLLEHARRSVPYYREALAGLDLAPGGVPDADAWRGLPTIGRRTIQNAGAALESEQVPAALGGTFYSETSGSTGEPVRLRRCGLERLLWEAMTLREHYWHGRDFSAKLASIRVYSGEQGAAPDGTVLPHWGAPAATLHRTGPLAALTLDADIDTQVRWLARHDPDYLMTYPSNLGALIEHAATHGWKLPRLREVRTLGETLSDALRARCTEVWGVPLVDVYSSRELGYIALQCPLSGHYHVAAETLLVEVLDDAGRPAAVGQRGRLVVTPLHNYAAPLLRYELGDLAEVGPPCTCGRGLPTLARIVGRTRNLVVLPDGSRHWPQVGFADYRAIAPVRQFQLVQHSLALVEVRLVVERALSPTEEHRLAGVIRGALGHPFELRFDYHRDALPRGPGGKFEEFVSLLPA